jgi:hypothetical protein
MQRFPAMVAEPFSTSQPRHLLAAVMTTAQFLKEAIMALRSQSRHL